MVVFCFKLISFLTRNFISVQCHDQSCEKDKSTWKCHYAEAQKTNCRIEDQNDICYEEKQDELFKKGCWSKSGLDESELADMKKTGKARWQYSDSGFNITKIYCNTPLCNNEYEFPKTFKVDKV